MSDRTAWRSLLIAASLFAAQGVVGLLELGRGLANDRVELSLGLVGLLVAVGLTARLRSARRVGLVAAGLQLLLLPFGFLAALAGGLPAWAEAIGWVGTGGGIGAALPWWAASAAAAALQWRALDSEPVRRLFQPPPVQDGPRSLFPT